MPHLTVTTHKATSLYPHSTEGHTDELAVHLAQGAPAAFTTVLSQGHIWQYLETFFLLLHLGEGCYWHLVRKKTMNIVKQPTVHRTSPHKKELSRPKQANKTKQPNER